MKGMLLGSINHVSLTVSNLDAAMELFTPFLRFLGYTSRWTSWRRCCRGSAARSWTARAGSRTQRVATTRV